MTFTGLPEAPPAGDLQGLRDCLSKWPSGVAVVTTVDSSGAYRGFTATAFTSLSMTPPTVLVCLDRSSLCMPAFNTAPAMAIHLLCQDQRELAVRFATKGIDKFAGLDVERGLAGVPLLSGALGRLQCRLVRRIAAGDHVILVGLVCAAQTFDGSPLVYFARDFRTL